MPPCRGRCASFVLLPLVIIEMLFCSGILYGFNSLRAIYDKLGVYSHLCQSRNTSLLPIVEFNETDTFLEEYVTDKYPTCEQQSNCISTAFIVWNIFMAFSTLPIGIFFDYFGLRISKITGAVLFLFGCFCYGFTSYQLPHLLYLAGLFVALSSQLIIMSNMQISQLFPKIGSLLVALISGAFDSSSVVFAIISLLFFNGIGINLSFSALAICGCTLCILTSVLFMTRLTANMSRLNQSPSPHKVEKSGDLDDVKFNGMDVEKETNGIVINENDDKEDLLTEKNILDEMEKETENVPLKETDATDVLIIDNQGVLSRNEALDKRYPTLRSCILSRFFVGHVTFFALILLRFSFFLASLEQLISAQFGKESQIRSDLLGSIDYFLFAGIFVAPFAGFLIDVSRRCCPQTSTADLLDEGAYWASLQPLVAPIAVTTISTVLLSILVMMPNGNAFYVSFFMLVVCRGFLFSSQANSLLAAFPLRFFGRLFGVVFLISGFISFLQYAFLELGTVYLMEVNIILTIISCITAVQPVQIWAGVRFAGLCK